MYPQCMAGVPKQPLPVGAAAAHLGGMEAIRANAGSR